MGVIQTRRIVTRCGYAEIYPALTAALEQSGIAVDGQTNPIRGEAKRSMLKNRWASRHEILVEDGLVTWTVDMLGDKHHAIIDEVVALLPAHMVDDQGIADALERLGKMGRTFGWQEARKLHTFLVPDEHVVELAQGMYDDRSGMLMLTTTRLLFVDLGLKVRQNTDEFPLDGITSMSVRKKLGGETIELTAYGKTVAIERVAHGRADTFVQAMRSVRKSQQQGAMAAPTANQAEPDAVDQLRKLAELHAAGVLSDDEFATKKAQLLDRI